MKMIKIKFNNLFSIILLSSLLIPIALVTNHNGLALKISQIFFILLALSVLYILIFND